MLTDDEIISAITDAQAGHNSRGTLLAIGRAVEAAIAAKRTAGMDLGERVRLACAAMPKTQLANVVPSRELVQFARLLIAGGDGAQGLQANPVAGHPPANLNDNAHGVQEVPRG